MKPSIHSAQRNVSNAIRALEVAMVSLRQADRSIKDLKRQQAAVWQVGPAPAPKPKAKPKVKRYRSTRSRRWKPDQLQRFRATMAAKRSGNGQQAAEPEPALTRS